MAFNIKVFESASVSETNRAFYVIDPAFDGGEDDKGNEWQNHITGKRLLAQDLDAPGSLPVVLDQATEAQLRADLAAATQPNRDAAIDAEIAALDAKKSALLAKRGA